MSWWSGFKSFILQGGGDFYDSKINCLMEVTMVPREQLWRHKYVGRKEGERGEGGDTFKSRRCFWTHSSVEIVALSCSGCGNVVDQAKQVLAYSSYSTADPSAESAFLLSVYHLEGLVLFLASVLQRRAWLQFSRKPTEYLTNPCCKTIPCSFYPFHLDSPETRPY